MDGESGDLTTTFQDTDDRWTAVLERNQQANGAFLYAVSTTGIYCRPTCSSRRPLRDNVAFFDAPDDAVTAGFRPCKRCRPELPILEDANANAVAVTCRLIEESTYMPSLEELAAAAAMSRFHFHRIFKQTTGLTPKQYTKLHLAERVRTRLADTETVIGAVLDSGYQSVSSFYAGAAQDLGMPASTARAQGRSLQIKFAVANTKLGSVAVAATEKGVCAILLGDDPEELVQDLQRRFRNANFSPGDTEFDTWMSHVIALVEAPSLGLDLPLDIQGTAFQMRVWKTLQQIPPGQTMSYGEVANLMGEPGAARAVASACGANQLAIAIPCHRVVRRDGNLSGYRWGVERKARLLASERDQHDA